jgi:poly(3-hydroxybutyrate) depolymerase
MARGLLAVCLLLACITARGTPLPALGADASAITASGVSSGGYMAVQLHVAHSDIVRGVGAIAAGPYYCAQGSLWTARNACMTPGPWTPLPSIERLKAGTDALARAGRIDATGNLRLSRAWLFTGTEDRTVSSDVVKGLQEFYARYKLNAVLVADEPAGHAMVTANAGNACATSAAPYINNCDYDAAGELLRHLLGRLEPPGADQSARLMTFDQGPYTGGPPAAIGMAQVGYVYVPPACESARCRIHVAFHGCRQYAEAVGERFVREAGYNRWAQANRIIVLYPQTTARNGWSLRGRSFIFNPRGCWDWWGYTGAQYHTKSGAQIRAVKAMLDRLAKRPQ